MNSVLVVSGLSLCGRYRTRAEKAYYAMLEDLFRYKGSAETLAHFSEDVEFEFVHPPIVSVKVKGVEAFIQASIVWAVVVCGIAARLMLRIAGHLGRSAVGYRSRGSAVR